MYLTILAPEETPVLSSASKKKSGATFTEWTVDALSAPSTAGVTKAQTLLHSPTSSLAVLVLVTTSKNSAVTSWSLTCKKLLIPLVQLRLHKLKLKQFVN